MVRITFKKIRSILIQVPIFQKHHSTATNKLSCSFYACHPYYLFMHTVSFDVLGFVSFIVYISLDLVVRYLFSLAWLLRSLHRSFLFPFQQTKVLVSTVLTFE